MRKMRGMYTSTSRSSQNGRPLIVDGKFILRNRFWRIWLMRWVNHTINVVLLVRLVISHSPTAFMSMKGRYYTKFHKKNSYKISSWFLEIHTAKSVILSVLPQSVSLVAFQSYQYTQQHWVATGILNVLFVKNLAVAHLTKQNSSN